MLFEVLFPAARVLTGSAVLLASAASVAQNVDWPAYNGGRDGDHYSKLTQINRGNVAKLAVAWTYETGEKGGIQANPLVMGGVLYAYTPSQKVVALDAATGRVKWTFDSGIPGAQQPARGLNWWTDGKERRLFAGVMNFLYCLDPQTGKPIESFGENGRVDLRKGLREPYQEQSIALTTPGVVYKDMIIVGGRNPETHPAPPGDIRAFDVHSGQVRWVFHTIPRPGEEGYETWPADAYKTAGAANNWAGMALDEARGVVFVPTGSAVMDFYGGDRVGDDLYANTLLALDANTGKRLWHFQGVHHDIWDRDFPSPPALFTLERDGKTIEALAQTSKQGFLYLFDRVTGKPLYPIPERPYPASTVPGEVAAKTQALPEYPEPFARQRLTADMLTTRTPEAHAWAVKEFANMRSDGQFLPFALEKPTVVFPGFDGGAEWGGPAIDPVHKVLFVNANEMAWLGGLTPVGKGGSPGEQVYRQQCAVCHGLDRSGSPPSFPALTDASARLGDAKIAQTVRQGIGRMPSFPNLNDQRMSDLLGFLRTPAKAGADKKEMASDAQQPAPKAHEEDTAGRTVYAHQCAVCHGENREGIPPSFPMLIGLGARMSAEQTAELVHKGKGRMPPQPDLVGPELDALLRYLGVDAAENAKEAKETAGPPDYIFTGYKKFLDPEGYPAFQPPWGTLSAIDLKTGKYLWKINLGEYPELVAQGMKNTGSENYGGPVVTASGLLFIGATMHDRKFRAFDTTTGKLLWETVLPYAGVATPATYMVNGKQYVVIATSGARDSKTPQGGAYVAFALP
ncbi:c-type cytochrome [Acidobacteria bacterium AB60]|nr:c-type cytochrome [Acidobacteria bacterium AB60]